MIKLPVKLVVVVDVMTNDNAPTIDQRYFPVLIVVGLAKAWEYG